MATSPWVLAAPRLDSAVATLVAKFPSVPGELVRALVNRASHTFADARVQDYVPLLVERSVRAELEAYGTDLADMFVDSPEPPRSGRPHTHL